MDTLNIPRRREQGFVLILTLVILVVITLSSMAMMLTTRAGISASGNIAFRQAAVRVSDVAVEGAFSWVGTTIGANSAALDASAAGSGYYATHSEVDSSCVPSGVTTFSPVSYDFANTNCAVTMGSQPNGYSLYYVIHRMASSAGACPNAGCVAPSVTMAAAATNTTPGGSTESGASVFGTVSTSTSNQIVYYRITVKVAGPRRNNRYIQAFVY
jgi:type IV pilus assembly protein PilX